MSIINRTQLQFTYNWTATVGDDPSKRGNPDAAELNRHEGYEILPFLNKHCDSLAAALKAERMIRTALPSDVRSRIRVLDWLRRNWLFFR